MSKCEKCKHNHDEDFFICDTCIHDTSLKDKFEPLTNADRIRAWNDHELAETIANFVSDIDSGDAKYSDDPNGWLDWLKQPAEGE